MSAPTALHAMPASLRSRSSSTRLFSSCTQLQRINQVQPESSRYIDIPRAVQESQPARGHVKGFLPVPRELFGGKRDTDDQLRTTLSSATKGSKNIAAQSDLSSRKQWEKSMSVLRKQNLLEGALELRHRKTTFEARRARISKARTAARETALHTAVREDERLASQSHTFDLNAAMSGKWKRGSHGALETKSKAYRELQARKHDERSRDLHALYTKAQSFIVSKEQLDEAVETAFGTEEKPVIFTTDYGDVKDAHSVWAFGKPEKLATRVEGLRRRTMSIARGGFTGVALDKVRAARITQLAEEMTDGAIGKDLTKLPGSR